MSALPPPIIIDHFLTGEQCAAIIDTYERAITETPHAPALRRFGTWHESACWYLKAIGSQDVKDTLDTVRQRIVSETKRYFGETANIQLDFTNLTALGPEAFHPLHADYEKQDERGVWVDNHTPFRKYAAMVYLNTSERDYTGGHIQFPKIDLDVLPVAGRFVAFSGGRVHAHRTTPVVTGIRYAIATWLTTKPELFEQWH